LAHAFVLKGNGPPADSEVIEPVPAATVILLAPGIGGLDVLMVRRPPRGFFGGVWVFPGGTLDPGDLGDGDTSEDTAFRRAAVRELDEEVGIALNPEALAFVSRWVTPAQFPRRYDTWFYLAHISEPPPLTLATDELDEASFVNPAAALSAHQAQQWPMVLPTLAHVRWLARFTTIEQVMKATTTAKLDPMTPMVRPDGSLVPLDLPW
jgi:8-oxo-dGTP pyrophosphatase MutT (NUDIX family)